MPQGCILAISQISFLGPWVSLLIGEHLGAGTAGHPASSTLLHQSVVFHLQLGSLDLVMAFFQ